MFLDLDGEDIKNILNEELSNFLFAERDDLEKQIDELEERIRDMDDRIFVVEDQANENEVETVRIRNDTSEYRRELQNLIDSNSEPERQALLREDVRAGEEAIERLLKIDEEKAAECSRYFSAKEMLESELLRLEERLLEIVEDENNNNR
jgi:TolA-binding protein